MEEISQRLTAVGKEKSLRTSGVSLEELEVWAALAGESLWCDKGMQTTATKCLCYKVPVSEHGRDFPVQGVCVHLGAHCESRPACTVRGNACASESHKGYCSFPWKLGSDSLGGFKILRLMEQHFTVSAYLCVQRPGCLVLYKLPSKKLISSFWVWDNTSYTNKTLLPRYFHNYWNILAKLNLYSDKTGTLNVISLLIGWKNFWPCSERFSGKNQS